MKMKANYHTHTWRCMHAQGDEREYVERAIEGGLKILGFSDHTPMPYPGEYRSPSKMRLDQLEGYVNTVLGLKDEYKNDIEIHLGLEVEYYPAYFEEMLEITGQYPIEYFLLGQHFLGNEVNDCASPEATDDSVRLERYCRQTIEALETGCFTYFAHPDILHFTGDREVFRKWNYWLCCRAKELEIPLEVNFLGIWDHRFYPNPEFWKIAGEVGNTVVFGADAHLPEKVWNPQALAVAEKIASDNHLTVAETVKFRNPQESRGGKQLSNTR